MKFRECSENTIKKMHDIGIRKIANSKTVMQWNQNFRVAENFPHPNIYIQMNKTYQSPFLETFPEVKLEIIQWTRKNIGSINCELVMIHLREKIVPIIYKSYLEDYKLPHNSKPTFEDFLQLFNLKIISHNTTWR